MLKQQGRPGCVQPGSRAFRFILFFSEQYLKFCLDFSGYLFYCYLWKQQNEIEEGEGGFDRTFLKPVSASTNGLQWVVPAKS